jgi:sugar/nucleoside kinase (ribokinase family)
VAPEEVASNGGVTGTESETKAGFQNFGGSYAAVEGFYAGPAVGAGAPDCMRSSTDASKLYAMLLTKKARTEEGPDDLRELKVILSKVTCLKRDLLGNAGLVEATRYQPFSTAHDLEPVAETAARCFAKTIPQRDLSLSLNKWGSRGTFLLKRLCTSYDLTDAEEEEALALFGRVMGDITEVASSVCCSGAGPAVIAGKNQPRMVGGYEPPAVGGLREYSGYY